MLERCGLPDSLAIAGGWRGRLDAKVVDDELAAARQALAEWRWDAAHERFESALREQEYAEALEGLAMAATWLDDAATAIGARERAYRLYRQQGDHEGAVRVAMASPTTC